MLCVSARGFTLAELLGALAILAVIAAIAYPSFSGGDAEQKLDLAAAEISQAIEFARGEAIHSGEPHALHSESNGQITLHSLDTSGVSPVLATILLHPVSKKDYQFNVLTAPHTTGVELSASTAPFAFESSTGVNITARDVYFTATGAPHYIDSSGVYYRLTSGSIGLLSEGFQRTISLAPISGRVTVQ